MSPPAPSAPAAIRVLIVDDEPIARQVLRSLLAGHPAYALVGEAGTFSQAATRLGTHDYDLVLLDVQLRGGNGFDLVPCVRPGARIIFVTAYDRYALRAFEVNALDYLLKPVSAERFAAALQRTAPSSSPAAGNPAMPQPASVEPEEPRFPMPFTNEDRVFIRTDAGDRFVPVGEIAAVFSEANYSSVHLRSGARLFTRRTMKTWEELLPTPGFMRVHRHVLVNLAAIERHTRVNELLELRVAGLREPVGVSRQRVGDLLSQLGAGQ